ncbi:MAG: Inositol 2-dehydrogenase [Verrucomicrobiota bacterium]|jgi:predicted dehydrogenase
MNLLHSSRRAFLQTGGLLAAGAVLSPRAWAQVPGANDAIRIGMIGLNGRGAGLLKVFRQVKGVRIVALCDVNREVLQRAEKTFKEKRESVRTYEDLREMLPQADVDAVVIATPHHQHALQAVWACQAGKDVYVEKPVSHNIWEGRQLVAAAEKYHRIVQAGMQSRSRGAIRDAVEWVTAGNLGRIVSARGLCYKRRASIGKTAGPQPIPETVNYDLWLGPAPHAPLRRKNLNYDWHWQWATGNGDLGNQGVHEMDIARWFLGERGAPPHTLSVGGRLGYEDDGETANTQVILHEYARAPLIFEVRGLPNKPDTEKMDEYRGASVGVVVTCEGGSVVVDARRVEAFDREGQSLREFKAHKGDFLMGHFQNFLDVVRSRKTDRLNAPIAVGHVSSALCHLGNISQRLGKPSRGGQTREKIQGNAALAEAVARMEEHLVANRMDLKNAPVAMAAHLTFDGATEKFVANADANALLTREYRKAFVVPKLA